MFDTWQRRNWLICSRVLTERKLLSIRRASGIYGESSGRDGAGKVGPGSKMLVPVPTARDGTSGWLK